MGEPFWWAFEFVIFNQIGKDIVFSFIAKNWLLCNTSVENMVYLLVYQWDFSAWHTLVPLAGVSSCYCKYPGVSSYSTPGVYETNICTGDNDFQNSIIPARD